MNQRALSQMASEAFFGEANGKLMCEFYPPIVNKRVEDIVAFYNYDRDPSPENLAVLFSNADKNSVASLQVGKGISGEWFNKIKLGPNVFVGENFFAMGHGGIDIGENTVIGENVMAITVGHGTHASQRGLNRYGKIVIGKNVIVQDGAMIVHPTNSSPLVIPDGSIIRANSLIVRAQDIDSAIDSPGVEQRKLILAAFAAEGKEITKYTDRDTFVREVGVKDPMFLPPAFIRKPENLKADAHVLFNNSSAVIAEGNVKIGTSTFLAPKVTVFAEEGSSVVIGSRVWLGAGATVVAKAGQHLEIGEGCLLAAGALVTQDIPAHSLVVGNGQIKRAITEADIKPVPAEWTDPAYVQERINEITPVVAAAQQGRRLAM